MVDVERGIKVFLKIFIVLEKQNTCEMYSEPRRYKLILLMKRMVSVPSTMFGILSKTGR